MMNQDSIIKEIIDKCNLVGYSGLSLIYNGSPESTLALYLSVKTQKKTICFATVIDDFVKQICPDIITQPDVDEFELFKNIIQTSNDKNLMVINSYEYITLNIIQPWKRFLNIGNHYPFKDLLLKDIVDFNLLNRLPVNENKNYKTTLTIPYEDLIWADEINKRFNNILYLEKDPSKHPSWFSFIMPQKQILSKLHHHLKICKNYG